jgi:hypothetical protein
VERAMERIKNFRIIQGVMPISMSERVSKIVFAVCALYSGINVNSKKLKLKMKHSFFSIQSK